MKTKLLIILSLFTTIHADAGSATWNLNPATNNWNTATNWTPATVPNATTDTATFGASNTLSVLTSTNVDLATLVFSAAAPSYTIATDHARTTSFWDEGVRNDSGVQESFTGNFAFNGSSSAGDNVTYNGGTTTFNDSSSAASASFSGEPMDFFDSSSAQDAVFTNANVVFHDNSTAGNGTFITGRGSGNGNGSVALYDAASAGNANFTISGSGGGILFDMWGGTLSNATLTVNGGATDFSDTFARIQFSSTADQATLVANGGLDMGEIFFQYGATAGEATLTANPTAITGGTGGSLRFLAGASAGDSHITVNGAGVTGDIAEGLLTFTGGTVTTAANATIVATAGSNGGKGGLVQFMPNANGGTCRISLLGNSVLDLDPHRDLDLTIGSLEGEGTATVGGHTLFIGSNNLSTTFSGLIEDGLLVGAVAKIGTGTLTLSGASTYTGGTTVSSGILLVSNSSGSGTGTGAVTVNGGTLGGSGIIAGAVTVGAGAFLAPAAGTNKQLTLTLQSNLTLQSGATYTYTFKARKNQARTDLVVAKGVTVNGATISLLGKIKGTLTPGTVLTVISNTSANAITGTFSNLADGAVVTVNGNNFQASYTGGDGNDLNLTVVP